MCCVCVCYVCVIGGGGGFVILCLSACSPAPQKKKISTHLLTESKPSHACTHSQSTCPPLSVTLPPPPPPPPSLLSAAGDVDASSVTYVNNIFYVKNDFLVQVETWTPAPSLVGAMRTFFIGYKFSQYSIYSILHSHIYIYIYIYIYVYIHMCTY